MLDRLKTFEGWTIADAIRRCVDPDLFDRQRVADEAWRAGGSRTRFVVSTVKGVSSESARKRALYDSKRNADTEIVQAFRTLMAEGRMVATGRRTSPVADAIGLPSSAWPSLVVRDTKRSTVAEETRDGIRVFDVRIFSIVHAPNAPELIAGTSLVEAFRDFVLGDPELVIQTKEAMRRHPEYAHVYLERHCYPHGAFEWPVDWGHFQVERYRNDSSEDDLLFETPEAVKPAERLLADRFRALVELLRSGEVVARGVPTRPNYPVVIPRSVWSHDDYHIDLVHGDLLRWNRSATHPVDRLIGCWSALMLERGDRHAGSERAADRSDATNAPELPAPARAGRKRDQTTIAAREACREWLATEMRKSPDERPHQKRLFREKALEQWQGRLTGRAFDMAWSRAIEDTGAMAWSFAGAPPKKLRRPQSVR